MKRGIFGQWAIGQRLSMACVGLMVVGTLASCIGNSTEEREEVDEASTAPLPELTVGIQVSPAMALVMVAEGAGLFDEHGINVELKEFTAGKFALQAFLGGSLDVAVSGEVPVTLATLQGHDFRVIAQVVDRTVNEVRVVARREEGLDTPEKYFGTKRRKLATSFGGGPEFFTYSFLRRHGIASESVELISQRPEDMPATLASGTVDAIAIFDPFARIAERELGEDGITFTDEDIYSELYVVDVSQELIDKRSNDLRAFLRGLVAAEELIRRDTARAQRIVQEYTQLEPIVIEEIWPNFVFAPALNDLFVEYTTAQAQWAIEKGDFPAETRIPDFRGILAPELLTEIEPGAVRLSSLSH